MAELVDAQDLKSCVGQPTCQFDSGSRHVSLLVLQGGFFFYKEVLQFYNYGVLLWNFILTQVNAPFLQFLI